MKPIVMDVGTRFGRLVVIGPTTPISQNSRSLCRCDCGEEVAVRNMLLKRGDTKSCGCLHREGNNATHGHARAKKRSSTYWAWAGMIQRCNNPKDRDYHNYGARGIKVDPRWVASFEVFLSDIGERPIGRSLDRIRNEEGYFPGNVRWATAKEQNRNTRRNRIVTVRGKTGPLSEVVEYFGVSPQRVKSRLKRGWEIEEAFFHPKLRTKSSAVH